MKRKQQLSFVDVIIVNFGNPGESLIKLTTTNNKIVKKKNSVTALPHGSWLPRGSTQKEALPKSGWNICKAGYDVTQMPWVLLLLHTIKQVLG